MTNSEQALREKAINIFADIFTAGGEAHEVGGQSFDQLQQSGYIDRKLTALIEEHYVSKEGYIALENMLAKTEAALMEQKQLYFKLFEEEINCMYCEAKIRRGSAIILCKECAENTEV